jgi:hypothetical protein
VDTEQSNKKQNKKAKLKEQKLLNALENALPLKLKAEVEAENKLTLDLNDETQNRINAVNEARKMEHDRFVDFMKCADPPMDKYCWISTEWLLNFAQLRPSPINNAPLLCTHGNLRINAESNNKNTSTLNVPMKRISHSAWNLISDWYGNGGLPLDENSLCHECVLMRSEDKEKEKNSKELFATMKMEYNSCIYNAVQTKKVLCYYASAPFLSKWQASNLKAADTDINKDLVCEHGFLKPVDTKAKISELLWQYLYNQFPDSHTFSMTENDCPKCSKEKRETAILGETIKNHKADEKTVYMDVFKKQYLLTTCLKPQKTYYMLPRTWVSEWKKYVSNLNSPAPGEIDNQPYVTFSDLAEHVENAEDQLNKSANIEASNNDDLPPMFLAYDPVEDQALFYIVEESDWTGLHNIYGGGPAITIMKTGQNRFITFPPTNEDVIAQKKIEDSHNETNFTMGTVTVTYKGRGKKNSVVNKNLKVKTNADTLVDTFKLQIFEVGDIDPISQTLFFNKTKLENHKSLSYYGIKENSVIELEIGEGNEDATWTDVFNVHENAIEEGFKGSVLHDSGSLSSSNSKNNSQEQSLSTSSPAKSPSLGRPINNDNNNNNNNAKPSAEPFWTCGICTVHNHDLKSVECDTCGAPRKPKEAVKVENNLWKCDACTFDNEMKSTKCACCDANKPRKK